MTWGKRYNHLSVFKANVVLAAPMSESTLAELSGQFGVHPKQILGWRKRLARTQAVPSGP